MNPTELERLHDNSLVELFERLVIEKVGCPHQFHKGDERCIEFDNTKNEILKRMAARMSFPQYLMKINGIRNFLPLGRAGAAYDSGHVPIEIGRYVLENKEGLVRLMENKDKVTISDAADKHSASK